MLLVACVIPTGLDTSVNAAADEDETGDESWTPKS